MNRVDTKPARQRRWHWINVPLVVVLVWISLQWTGCSHPGPFQEESLNDSAAIRSQEAIAALQIGPTVPMTGTHATAVFAAGCFWSTEAAFKQLKGVHAVTSGFAGGSKETANYRRVCEGDTGHAEAVRIRYTRITSGSISISPTSDSMRFQRCARCVRNIRTLCDVLTRRASIQKSAEETRGDPRRHFQS